MSTAKEKKLTPKQERFVQEYLVDLNATQAAIRAGYSEKTANNNANQLMVNNGIAEAVKAGMEKRAAKTEITQERVLKELARIGFSDLRKVVTPSGNLIDPTGWDDDTAAAISSLEVVTTYRSDSDKKDKERRSVDHTHKIKLWDKNSALEKVAKHLGMFVDRHEHSGPGGKPIEIEELSAGDTARRIAFLLGNAGREGSGGAGDKGDGTPKMDTKSGAAD